MGGKKEGRKEGRKEGMGSSRNLKECDKIKIGGRVEKSR